MATAGAATNMAVRVASARCSAANSVAFAPTFAPTFALAVPLAVAFVAFISLGLLRLRHSGRRWRGYAGGGTHGRGWERRRRLSGRRQLGRIHANRLCEQCSVGSQDAADMRGSTNDRRPTDSGLWVDSDRYPVDHPSVCRDLLDR